MMVLMHIHFNAPIDEWSCNNKIEFIEHCDIYVELDSKLDTNYLFII